MPFVILGDTNESTSLYKPLTMLLLTNEASALALTVRLENFTCLRDKYTELAETCFTYSTIKMYLFLF